MEKDKLQKIVEKVVKYYFDGLGINKAIDKAIKDLEEDKDGN